MLLAPAAGAHAETYGELGHFGSAGVGHGQFKITTGTHAFGVDPSDNSVYVGDEPKKRDYRIQKLTASGEYLAETPMLTPPNHAGIEGIAVDPALKRIYLLAVEARETSLTRDPGKSAAGTLYAFSTEPSGEALLPASGANAEGVLAGPSTLESQSDVPEAALLEPAGIAVDPTTHEVIVMGDFDQAQGTQEPQWRVALERVQSDGTLGERYVDSTDFFSESADRLTPSSPVVTADGTVYVSLENELVQIPSKFSSTAPPASFVQFVPDAAQGEGGEPIVKFDQAETSHGGGLSYVSEGVAGSESKIYAKASVGIVNGEDVAYYPGVLAFDGDGSELGWTGGQSIKVGESCAVSSGGETYSSVAAGSARKVFMFDPGKASPPRPPRVDEFGPGGGGCPPAEASEPVATVDGKPLTPSETVSSGTPVELASTMTQANALSVEWSFGDGTTETVNADEYQHTEVTHAFVRGGQLTVTETIHTDDLATPTIVKQTKVSVSDVAVPPIAVLEGPLKLTLGAEEPERLVYLEGGGLGLQGGKSGGAAALATFDGSASFDPNAPGSNQIKSYHWVFGDGSSETTEGPTATHPYEKAGVYKVELTVTDALGLASEPSTLRVEVDPAPVPATEAVHQAAQLPAVSAAGPPASSSSSSPAPVPAAGLASTSLAASRAGVVQLVLTCPVGETSCAGTITLRTLGAVSGGVRASRSHARKQKAKATVVTLAVGKFTVVGGRQKTLTLRLSAPARSLLARSHRLRARATIVSHDPAGATHTTELTVALRALEGHVKK
jgi:PKD repeat protein